jgi:hypothetical protein
LLSAWPAFAQGRPTLDEYKKDKGRVEAFLADYLESEWGLKGENTGKLVGWVVKYSLANDTDPLIQMARILKESSGRHYRLNSRGERQVVKGDGGSIGLSQVHPFWIGKTVSGEKITKEKLLDPESNVRIGILLYKRYDYGDYMEALTHYNNPKAKSPNTYAKNVDRIYKYMLTKFRSFEYIPPPVKSAQGSAILVR